MAGVWEDARHAYVHETLVRRTGIAAALGVLYVALVQSLLQNGKIDFAVRVDCTAPGRLPRAEVRSAVTLTHYPAVCLQRVGYVRVLESVIWRYFPALQTP